MANQNHALLIAQPSANPFPFTLLPCLLAGLVLLGSLGCHTSKPDTESTDISPVVPVETGQSLFDGQSLAGWELADIAGRGEVTVEDGVLTLGMGYMTGIVWTNGNLPKTNYEITLDAMRVDGSDFFCGLTFPVGDSFCSFIAGGWGGGVMGLSNIDDMDAANNDTTTYRGFEEGRWYAVKVRVTPAKIEAWVDGEQVVDQVITDRDVSIRIEMESCVPLGLASYSTTAALRNIRLNRLAP
jgi:hypothetical protein